MKKFILNADDLGKSRFNNNAILEAIDKGLLKSASLMANMSYYSDAIEKIVLPNKDKLSTGVHLNIIEGKSINQNLTLLCDKNNNFNKSFLMLFLLSNNNEFLKQVEKEFRSQIELCLKYFKPTHLDSHVHVHSIPNIFKIVVKLAIEYNIKQIRTQYEIPYFVPSSKYSAKSYFINQIKVGLLNVFTEYNKPLIKKYNLTTNDYIIGVSYTSMMNSKTILEGIKKIGLKDNITVEALIHPKKYEDDTKDNHTKEFEITLDENLKSAIKTLGYTISNYLN